jgi:hypothetical protein
MGIAGCRTRKREWRARGTQAQRPAVREQSRESIKDRRIFYSIIAAGGWRLAAGGWRLAVRDSRFKDSMIQD